MTFVGKILVIVIMAFALLFLGISTVVFTTATDWKKLADTQKQKIGKLTKDNADATTDIENAKKDLTKVKSEQAAAKKALDDKIAALNADIERMQKEITAARGELVTAQQTAHTSLEEADAARKERDQVREQRLAVEKQANDFKIRQTELNDQIQILTRERDVAKRNADDLRDRTARAMALLRKHGLSDDISNIQALDTPPPVHGEVAQVDAQNKKLVLTVGSDDGLLPGHELFVFRTRPRPEYLGKIRILKTDPDQAVGVVIGTTIQGKKIKEGDIVSTSIRNGPQL